MNYSILIPWSLFNPIISGFMPFFRGLKCSINEKSLQKIIVLILSSGTEEPFREVTGQSPKTESATPKSPSQNLIC